MNKEFAQQISRNYDRVMRAAQELEMALNIAEMHDKSVTIFGSARTKPEDPYYQSAERIAQKISEAGYAVVTGGGPGMMSAGNQGGADGGSDSIGFGINLPFEQSFNKYASEHSLFHYFFTRKVALTYSAEAYIYMPGGFGTLDELFEILTLIQTKKIPAAPVVLVGKAFWDPLDSFIKSVLRDEFKTISEGDEELYTIVDIGEEGEQSAVDMALQAPIRIGK